MATSGEEPLFDDFHRVSLSSSSPRRMDERRGHSREYLFSRNENSARGGGGGSVYEGDVGAREHGVGVASPSYGASAGPSRTPNSSSVKRSSSRQRVRYTAFLLDDLSRCSLLVWMREMGAESPGDWVTTCDHVTIHHSPSAAQLASFPFGVPCEMRVLGAAGDERSRAVHVDVPDFVPQPASATPYREVPHVTVACAPGVRPMISGEMLADAIVNGGYVATHETMPLTLTGRLGGVTTTDERTYEYSAEEVTEREHWGEVRALSPSPEKKMNDSNAVDAARDGDDVESSAMGSPMTETEPTSVVEVSWGARRRSAGEEDKEVDAEVDSHEGVGEGEGEGMTGGGGARGSVYGDGGRSWWGAATIPGEWPPEQPLYPSRSPSSSPPPPASPPPPLDDDVADVADWEAAGAAAGAAISNSSSTAATAALATATRDRRSGGGQGGDDDGGGSHAAGDAAIAMLSSMFPHVADEIVTATLEAFGWEVNAAAEHLLFDAGGGVGGAGGGGGGHADAEGEAEGLEDWGGEWERRGSQTSLSGLSDNPSAAAGLGTADCGGGVHRSGGRHDDSSGGGDSLSRLFAGTSAAGGSRAAARTEPTPVNVPVLAPPSGTWGSGRSDAVAGASGPSFAARRKIDQLLEVFPGCDPEVVAAALAESGGDRHAASGTLADIMMARQEEEQGRGGGGGGGGLCGRTVGGEGAGTQSFVGGGGGKRVGGGGGGSENGHRSGSGSGAAAGFGGEGSDGSSSSSCSKLGSVAAEAADAFEWELVKRRSHHRSSAAAPGTWSPSPAALTSGKATQPPERGNGCGVDDDDDGASSASGNCVHLESALAHIRRRQAPEVAPESRRGEAALHREVQRLHEHAAALHSSRASLSALSRAAFQRGDGKLAKDLSHRAAVLEAKISAAKETAAQTAMRFHNNRNNGGGGGGGGVLDVDLHGQTTDTAVETLRRVLMGAVNTNATGVRMVTGVGRHSVGGRARLLPVIRNFLHQSGLLHVEESPGTLFVPFGARR